MNTKLSTLVLLGTIIIPVTTVAKKHPNIIWIMTDQQWAGAMSCAGNTDLHTPNMDRLAANGVRFTNAYCSMPLSGPSRSAMFTGYMPSKTGALENGKPLPDSLMDNTLGLLIKSSGYDCAYAGKWHVNAASLPSENAFGFKRIAMNGDKGLADSCVQYLEGQHKTPFFLVASFTNPHNICEYARGQNTPDSDIKFSDTNDCPNLPYNFAVNPYDASILQYEKSLNKFLYPTVNYTPDQWRHYRDAYCRLVEAVDAQIGKIIDVIDNKDLWENTVVIFTSDHGDGTGAHHWNQKTALYEEVANVPLIVCLPGKKNAGKVSPALVNNGIDMMPSICDWAGTGVPQGRRGVSFRRVAEKLVKGQDHIITETNFNQTGGTRGWMVRTLKYKYVVYDKGEHREQLYDMSRDRGEMRNLAEESSYNQILEENRNLLRCWFKTL